MRMMRRRVFRDLVRIFVMLGKGRRSPECQQQKRSGKDSFMPRINMRNAPLGMSTHAPHQEKNFVTGCIKLRLPAGRIPQGAAVQRRT